MDPASKILERIQMKYIDDYDDIKKYFAAFHLLESFPAAVIIDDFGDFFTKVKYDDKFGRRDRNFSMVHALGLCSNAIAHANKKLQPSDSCKLLLSETRKLNSTTLFIYKRWINSIFTIEDTRGDGAGSFFLKRKPDPYNNLTRMRTAKYSVTYPFLTLEEIANE